MWTLGRALRSPHSFTAPSCSPSGFTSAAAASSSHRGTSIQTGSGPRKRDGSSSTSRGCSPSRVTTRTSTAYRLPPRGTARGGFRPAERLCLMHPGVHDRDMDFSDPARDLAERAAGVLAPESGLVQDMDAAGFGDALLRAIRATVTNPMEP